MCGLNGAYDGIKAFCKTDVTEDLNKIDVPTLIFHVAMTRSCLQTPRSVCRRYRRAMTRHNEPCLDRVRICQLWINCE